MIKPNCGCLPSPLCGLVHESDEPVFITKNAVGDMVVLSLAAWEREQPQSAEGQLDTIIMGLDQLERHPLSAPVRRQGELALPGRRVRPHDSVG